MHAYFFFFYISQVCSPLQYINQMLYHQSDETKVSPRDEIISFQFLFFNAPYSSGVRGLNISLRGATEILSSDHI